MADLWQTLQQLGVSWPSTPDEVVAAAERLYFAQQRPELALELLRERHASDPRVLAMRANLTLGTNDLDEAERIARECPEIPLAAGVLGNVAFLRGAYAESVPWLRRALAHPVPLPFYDVLVRALGRSGRPAEAVQVAEEALARGVWSEALATERVRMLLAADRVGDALDAAIALLAERRTATALVRLAEVLQRLGRLETAGDAWTCAACRDDVPEGYRAHPALAWDASELCRRQRVRAAALDAVSAAERAPLAFAWVDEDQSLPEVRVRLGLAAAELGDWSTAWLRLGLLWMVVADRPEVVHAAARAGVASGDAELARWMLRVAPHPEHAPTWLLRADIEDDAGRALAVVDGGLAAVPGDPALTERRAELVARIDREAALGEATLEVQAALHRADRTRAEAVARGAVDRFPDDSRSWYLLAVALGAAGRAAEAEAALREALARPPVAEGATRMGRKLGLLP